MSHTLKVFLCVIQERIYRRIGAGIGETQFGFRKGLSTREAMIQHASTKEKMQKC